MHYKSTSEKIAIIPRKVTQPLTANIFKENCEIRSTRRKILSSLSIELVCVISYSKNIERYFIVILGFNGDLFYSTNR